MFSDEEYLDILRQNPNLDRHPDFLDVGTNSRDFKSNKIEQIIAEEKINNIEEMINLDPEQIISEEKINRIVADAPVE